MSATSGPSTRVCTTSPIAKAIATPARRLAAASSEWISVAGKTASRLTAKSAPVDRESVCATHPCHDAHRRDLRDHDEGRVEEKDDPDCGGANRCVGLCERRQDVREERVADDDEHDVECDHGDEHPVSSDGAKAGAVRVCRRDGLRSQARHGSEHDQRESGGGDRVEEIENLERAEALCGCHDEARDCRAGTNTEVARDAVEREGGHSLIGRDQPDHQCPVGRPCRAEPGSAGDRAGERLPGTVDVGEAGVAEGARQASCDHDRFRGVAVEHRSRRRGDDCGRPHRRRQNQSGRGR